MSLQLQHIEPTQTLTCIAINTATGSTESVQKQLNVTGMSDQNAYKFIISLVALTYLNLICL